MSNESNSLSFYVGDLDRYVTIHEDRPEPEPKVFDTVSIGPILLLSEKKIGPTYLDRLGVNLEVWNWHLYRARQCLRQYTSWEYLQPLAVKELLSAGRAYAIRRYAKFERLPVTAALTASLPYGIIALLFKFFAEEGVQLSHTHRLQLESGLRNGLGKQEARTAYTKTASIQAGIHAIAKDVWGDTGHLKLDRQRMRIILSLSRLHFSIAEIKCRSFQELADLNSLYEAERESWRSVMPEWRPPEGRNIRNWRSRHLKPLTFYYPIMIRDALTRGILHQQKARDEPIRQIVANELALAYCSSRAVKKAAGNRRG